jgi:hypothetical protein
MKGDEWDDLRAWMQELGIERSAVDEPDAVGLPLLRRLGPERLADRLGRDRFGAFMELVKQEFQREAATTARLAREGGLKFDAPKMLEAGELARRRARDVKRLK